MSDSGGADYGQTPQDKEPTHASRDENLSSLYMDMSSNTYLIRQNELGIAQLTSDGAAFRTDLDMMTLNVTYLKDELAELRGVTAQIEEFSAQLHHIREGEERLRGWCAAVQGGLREIQQGHEAHVSSVDAQLAELRRVTAEMNHGLASLRQVMQRVAGLDACGVSRPASAMVVNDEEGGYSAQSSRIHVGGQGMKQGNWDAIWQGFREIEQRQGQLERLKESVTESMHVALADGGPKRQHRE